MIEGTASIAGSPALLGVKRLGKMERKRLAKRFKLKSLSKNDKRKTQSSIHGAMTSPHFRRNRLDAGRLSKGGTAFGADRARHLATPSSFHVFGCR